MLQWESSSRPDFLTLQKLIQNIIQIEMEQATTLFQKLCQQMTDDEKIRPIVPSTPKKIVMGRRGQQLEESKQSSGASGEEYSTGVQFDFSDENNSELFSCPDPSGYWKKS